MKKFLVIALVLGLSVSLLGPASAGKKKAPKPYSEEFTTEIGHPVLNSASEGSLVSVTGQEFLTSCAVPGSNGLDGYVIEVPAPLRTLSSTVEAVETSTSAVPADLDMYFFSETCEGTGVANAVGTDEFGAILPGTAFIFVHNYTGGPTDSKVTITPVK